MSTDNFRSLDVAESPFKFTCHSVVKYLTKCVFLFLESRNQKQFGKQRREYCSLCNLIHKYCHKRVKAANLIWHCLFLHKAPFQRGSHICRHRRQCNKPIFCQRLRWKIGENWTYQTSCYFVSLLYFWNHSLPHDWYSVLHATSTADVFVEIIRCSISHLQF